jgi:hypothetical protein
MRFKTAFVLPVALAASVFAMPSVTQAKDKDAAEAEVDDNESFPAAEFVIPTPPPGKGQIVLYRKGGLGGSAVSCSVSEGGQKISSLGGGKLFVLVTTPGKHEFSTKTEAKDVLALEVEPDETQFVQCKIKMGFMIGRPDIRPSSEAEFRANKKFKLVHDDDMGPGPGALRAAELRAAQAATKPAATAAAPAPAS